MITPLVRLRVLPALLPINGRDIEIRLTDTGIIQQRRVTGPDGVEDAWRNVIDTALLKGDVGPETELRYNGSYIQYRPADSLTWTDIVRADDLVSPYIGTLQSELNTGLAQISDAVSQGNVPIYATIQGMSAISVPAAINAIRVNGRAVAGDGQGGLFTSQNNGSTDTFTSADGRTWYRGDHKFPGDAVPRSVYANLNKFPTPDDYGADPTGVADSTLAFAKALAANRVIYIKNNATYLVSGPIALSQTGHSIIGDGHGQGRIISNSPTADIITLASGVARYKVCGFSLSKSVTPTAGYGVRCIGSTDLSEVSDLVISNLFDALRTSTCDQGKIARLMLTQNVRDGWYATNESNYGPAQWEVQDLLCTRNGRDGVRVQSTAGPSDGSGSKGLILGTWNSIKTFANSGRGIQLLGSAGGFGGVFDMRLNNPFIGSDALAGIRIDGYGGKHVIVGGFVERCGMDPTGPDYTTPPSNNATGIQIGVNETDTITLTGVLVDINSRSGLRSGSGSLSITGCQFLGNGQAMVAGDRAGISIDGGNAIVSGCKSANIQGGNLAQAFGLAIGVNAVNATGNDFRGNATAPVFRGVTLNADNSSLSANTPAAANGLT